MLFIKMYIYIYKIIMRLTSLKDFRSLQDNNTHKLVF